MNTLIDIPLMVTRQCQVDTSGTHFVVPESAPRCACLYYLRTPTSFGSLCYLLVQSAERRHHNFGRHMFDC